MSVSSINQYLSGETSSNKIANKKTQYKLEKLAKRAESSPSKSYDLDVSSKNSQRSKAADYRRASRNAAKSADTLDMSKELHTQVRDGLVRLKALSVKLKNSGGSASLKLEFDQLNSELAGLTSSKYFDVGGSFEDSSVELPEFAWPELMHSGSEEDFDAILSKLDSRISVLQEQQGDIDTVSALFEISAQNQEAAGAMLPGEGGDNLINDLFQAIPTSVSTQAKAMKPQVLDLLES